MSDKEYIERGAAIAEILSIPSGNIGTGYAAFILDRRPAADVEPVVHAHWVEKHDIGAGIKAFECSNCNGHVLDGGNETVAFRYPRCKWCGAHMDEDATE